MSMGLMKTRSAPWFMKALMSASRPLPVTPKMGHVMPFEGGGGGGEWEERVAISHHAHSHCLRYKHMYTYLRHEWLQE